MLNYVELNFLNTVNTIQFLLTGEAIHIPEQHYFTSEKGASVDANRDTRRRTYEHPMTFENRVLKQTIAKMYRYV